MYTKLKEVVQRVRHYLTLHDEEGMPDFVHQISKSGRPDYATLFSRDLRALVDAVDLLRDKAQALNVAGFSLTSKLCAATTWPEHSQDILYRSTVMDLVMDWRKAVDKANGAPMLWAHGLGETARATDAGQVKCVPHEMGYPTPETDVGNAYTNGWNDCRLTMLGELTDDPTNHPATPAQATPEGADLPPLPTPYARGLLDLFIPAQMRDYARAALAGRQPDGSSAAELIAGQRKALDAWNDTRTQILEALAAPSLAPGKPETRLHPVAVNGYLVTHIEYVAPDTMELTAGGTVVRLQVKP